MSQPLQLSSVLGQLPRTAVRHSKRLAAWQSLLYLPGPAVLLSSHTPFLSFVEPMHYSKVLFHYQKLPAV